MKNSASSSSQVPPISSPLLPQPRCTQFAARAHHIPPKGELSPFPSSLQPSLSPPYFLLYLLLSLLHTFFPPDFSFPLPLPPSLLPFFFSLTIFIRSLKGDSELEPTSRNLVSDKQDMIDIFMTIEKRKKILRTLREVLARQTVVTEKYLK